MIRVVDVVLSPAHAADPARVREAAEAALGWRRGSAMDARVVRRSVDARARDVRMQLRVELTDEGPFAREATAPQLPDVTGRPEVVIVGAGPGGCSRPFAASREGSGRSCSSAGRTSAPGGGTSPP